MLHLNLLGISLQKLHNKMKVFDMKINASKTKVIAFAKKTKNQNVIIERKPNELLANKKHSEINILITN